VKWSDGVKRPADYKEPDEHRFILDIFGKRLHEEWQRLVWENRELKARLEKNRAKAVGAK